MPVRADAGTLSALDAWKPGSATDFLGMGPVWVEIVVPRKGSIFHQF